MRIDHLASDHKDLLQTLAVIGTELRHRRFDRREGAAGGTERIATAGFYFSSMSPRRPLPGGGLRLRPVGATSQHGLHMRNFSVNRFWEE